MFELYPKNNLTYLKGTTKDKNNSLRAIDRIKSISENAIVENDKRRY